MEIVIDLRRSKYRKRVYTDTLNIKITKQNEKDFNHISNQKGWSKTEITRQLLDSFLPFIQMAIKEDETNLNEIISKYRNEVIPNSYRI